MEFFKKVILIGFSVAGTVIGAGFATGKEIMLFFPLKGIFFLFVSLNLMLIASLLYSYKKETKSDKIFNFIFICFLALSFSVMLSCGGETLKEASGLPYFIGIIITYLISLLIIHFNLKGIYIFNLIVSPLMMIFTLIISVNSLTKEVFYHTSPLLLSMSYCGYNLLSLVPFLKSLKKEEKNDKAFISGTFLGIFLVLICGIFIKLVTDKYFDIIFNSEIPMLKIALLNNNSLALLYSFLIYSAIITTAISSLLPLKEKGNIYFITFPLLLISFFGFSNLIKNIYGFFGNIGIIFIFYIIISTIFERKKQSDSRVV